MKTTHTFIESIPAGVKVVYINASLMKISACEKRMAHTMEGAIPIHEEEILRFGTAVHRFIYVYESTKEMGEALRGAMLTFGKAGKETTDLLYKACMAYKPFPEKVVISRDLKTMLEYEFAIPWRLYNYKGVDYAIVLFGTIDRLDYVGGSLRVFDYKTTRYGMIEAALKKYRFEVQMEFYKYILYEFGHRFLTQDDANLARDFKLNSNILICQIARGDVKYVMAPPSPWTRLKAERFKDMLVDFVERRALPVAAQIYSTDTHLSVMRDGWATNACNECNFADICHVSSPDMYDMLLKNNFQHRPYGPMSMVDKEVLPF